MAWDGWRCLAPCLRRDQVGDRWPHDTADSNLIRHEEGTYTERNYNLSNYNLNLVKHENSLRTMWSAWSDSNGNSGSGTGTNGSIMTLTLTKTGSGRVDRDQGWITFVKTTTIIQTPGNPTQPSPQEYHGLFVLSREGLEDPYEGIAEPWALTISPDGPMPAMDGEARLLGLAAQQAARNQWVAAAWCVGTS